ncbi:hypothetical protein J010_03883 [Cryptococcus neoformans]|nr:hypothetical protein C355_03779 [Cryptococcus neoformans var. grubii Th84]OXG78970.1 hypothetical protein C350_03855 [Cryptococcus neoformans var. grubii MW-RSA36]OXG85457.1 hypothetical protein C346_03919 [Cryptococcus neoformans var. grubii D17-1]OXG95174.1 hypothetical protein C345_03793 [Cryptococcus neoformans var. grubii A2-102-5]OXH08968.1 hypothetical protein J010_03883 [Cryptococcus neoformans var. grubii]OXL07818.1 hypothetical protein C348_04102 [Cryptococcus neoformans var. grub
MPPKGKKTKAEEALDFLSNLDNLDAPDTSSPPPTADATRDSTDSTRKSLSASRELPNKAAAKPTAEDEEAESALAFLNAQINQKRAKPLSDSRSGTPLSAVGSSAATGSASTSAPKPKTPATEPTNMPTGTPAPAQSSGGWGSFWSTATSALQSAQRVADEQYQKVKSEGVNGVTGQLESLRVNVKSVPGVDLSKLRKGAEERLGGFVRGVDLDKLRKDLVNTTSSTLTTILDTVAPPISEHETLELWLSHPMIGYAGVEGVIYRAWARILEQTESGELIIVWSPSPTPGDSSGEPRGINPVEGWDAAWELGKKEIAAIKAREEEKPRGRAEAKRNMPVTTVPIFLHLQPLLVRLPYAEPPIHSSTSIQDKPFTPPNHLYFLFTLEDPTHSLTFTTVSQPTPSDWMDVEYENSEWVEERLVEVLRTGVEVIAQDYVATRMGLKPSAPQAAAVAALVEQANQEGENKAATDEKKSD